MKNCIWIMICFLCISSYGVTEENSEKVIATLPEGITVELVGLRNYSIRDLEQFKDTEFREVNAAIGGTGSLLGAFRLEKHVLRHDPDLLFVEFAVNDSGTPDDSVLATMEGIVRQCWDREKKPDIVFVYTTAGNLDVPTNRHEAVAEAYGIPTVDFQATAPRSG